MQDNSSNKDFNVNKESDNNIENKVTNNENDIKIGENKGDNESKDENNTDINDDSDLNNKVLLEKISKLEDELTKANDRTLRSLAELENNRRSNKLELEKTIKFGISKLKTEFGNLNFEI